MLWIGGRRRQQQKRQRQQLQQANVSCGNVTVTFGPKKEMTTLYSSPINWGRSCRSAKYKQNEIKTALLPPHASSLPIPQSPLPSNRLSFHWNSIKLTNIRRPWGEGNGGWGSGCWPGHRTTDWRTWHSSTLPSPSCIHSSNPSMSPRTRTDFQLCHKLRRWGRGGGFSLHQLVFFFSCAFLAFRIAVVFSVF